MNVELARFNMIEQQVRPWDVLDDRVLEVMKSVPRERFVPEAYRGLAFADVEIPIGHGQAMLSPRMEGRILQALDSTPEDRILEVGTGTGYLTACLARLAGHVESVDIHDTFIPAAREHIAALGLDNVSFFAGDFLRGWSADGGYDAIAISGSLPQYRKDLEDLLRPGGRLFVVVGEAPAMEAMLVTRTVEGTVRRETLFETVLQPLEGASLGPRFIL